jgi:hypothetical protein
MNPPPSISSSYPDFLFRLSIFLPPIGFAALYAIFWAIGSRHATLDVLPGSAALLALSGMTIMLGRKMPVWIALALLTAECTILVLSVPAWPHLGGILALFMAAWIPISVWCIRRHDRKEENTLTPGGAHQAD